MHLRDFFTHEYACNSLEKLNDIYAIKIDGKKTKANRKENKYKGKLRHFKKTPGKN